MVRSAVILLTVLAWLAPAAPAAAQTAGFTTCPQRFDTVDRSFTVEAAGLDRASGDIVAPTAQECSTGAAAAERALESGAPVGAEVVTAPWNCIVQTLGAACFAETPARFSRVTAECQLVPVDEFTDDQEPACAIAEVPNEPGPGGGGEPGGPTTGARAPEVYRLRITRDRRGRRVADLSADAKGRIAYRLERRAGTRFKRVARGEQRMTEGRQRIVLPRRLRAGRYRVTVTPRLADGTAGKPVRRAFRVR